MGLIFYGFIFLCSPKIYVEVLTPILQNDMFFGNSVITDVISQDEVILEEGKLLVQHNWYPYKNKASKKRKKECCEERQTCTQGELQVRTGVMLPQAKKLLVKKLEESPGRDPSLTSSKEGWPCTHIDLGLPASKTMRQYISVVLNHSVCVSLLQQPLETDTQSESSMLNHLQII